MSDKLQMMLEDAKELNALGLMSDSEVDAIAVMVKAREVSARIAKVKSMTGEEIKAIRTRYGMSHPCWHIQWECQKKVSRNGNVMK